ncbi:MAG: hypothetical protein P9L88_08045, partial [Candidatus Tantalella remota]|nr:hypothetical protein [Candidatus Tantalella remota]
TDAEELYDDLMLLAAGNGALIALIEGIYEEGMEIEDFISALMEIFAEASLEYQLMALLATADLSSALDGEDAKNILLLLCEEGTNLYNLIFSLDASGMTKDEFLSALMEAAGFSEEAALIFAILSDMDLSSVSSGKEMMLLIIKHTLGEDAALEELITMLLTLDLEAFDSADDLLNMLLLLLAGPVLGELKEALDEMAIDWDTYSGDAESIFNTLFLDTSKSESLQSFSQQMVDLIVGGTLNDSDVLSALRDLDEGNGPAQLVRIILLEVPQGEDRDALLDIISGNNMDLVLLLAGIDMTGVETVDDLVAALMAVDTDGEGFPDLVEILLNTDPSDESDYPASLVYSYEVKEDALLKSQTFYIIDMSSVGETPRSIADHTLNYFKDGVTVRDTTVYYYENVFYGLVGIDLSSKMDWKKYLETLIYFSEEGSPLAIFLVSLSEDVGASFLNIGELCQHISDQSSVEGYTVISFDDLRLAVSQERDAMATLVTGDDRKTKVVTYTGDARESADFPAVIKLDADIKSETFYYFDSSAFPGEEVADYSFSYDFEGDVKSTSVFYYGNKRAEELDATETLTSAMDKSESFRGASPAADENKITGITYYHGTKGDEIVDYSHSLVFGNPSGIKSTSIFFYDNKRAQDLSVAEIAFSSMTKSESFRGGVTSVDDSKITGITYYYGEKGDELADYSHSTAYGERTDIKSTSIFFYADKRAEDLLGQEMVTAAMTKSEAFLGGVTDVDESNITGITYFHGGKDEELADYSHTTQLGDRANVRSTSIYFYDGNKRASELSVSLKLTSAMTRSESFHGAVDDIDESKITGITFYHGEKGDELVNYSYTTRFGSRNDIRSTSVMYYAGTDSFGQFILKRAYELEGEEIVNSARSSSDAYRGERIDASLMWVNDSLPPEVRIFYQMDHERRTGTTFFFGEKGDEIADYALSYNSQEDVLTTSVYYYEVDVYLKRAEYSGSKDLNSQVNVYRGNFQGSSAQDLTDIKAITYNHVEDRLKGEEIADYTMNYNSDGTATSTTVYFYDIGGSTLSAESADAESLNSQVNVYRGDYVGNAYDDTLNLKNVTHNTLTYTDAGGNVFARIKGEEIADYELTFAYDTSVSRTAFYYYSSDIFRAGKSTVLDSMDRRVVFRGDLSAYVGDIDYADIGTVQANRLVFTPGAAGEQIFDMDIQAFFIGDVEEEKQSYSYKYHDDAAGNRVPRGTTVFTYDPDGRMSMSTVYRGDVVKTAPDNVPELKTVSVKKSRTFYMGAEKEEKAQRTYTYDDTGQNVETTTVYSYVGDDLDYTMELTGEVQPTAVPGDAIESFTKYDHSEEQLMLYTYNFRGNATLKENILDFNELDIESSVIYSYSGEYLDWSMVLTGQNETADVGDIVESFTKYDANEDRKMFYTYNFTGDAVLTTAMLGLDFSGDAALLIDSSTIYGYGKEYLDWSMVLLGKEETGHSGAIVESYTKYDLSEDQKMVYTWNMEQGATYLDTNLYTEVADSTIYNYAGGQYLIDSTSLYGKVTDETVSDTDVVISYTEYDGSRYQRMNYTWNMEQGATYL